MDRHAQSWLLWQLGDSALPTGGFTASAGLEAAWQLGALQGDRALEDFVWSSTLAHCDVSLPLVIAAWDVAERSRSRQDDNDVVLHDESSNRETNVVDRNADPPYLGDLLRLDAEHDAVLSGNAVARRSSRAQGLAQLNLVVRTSLLGIIESSSDADATITNGTQSVYNLLCSFRVEVLRKRCAGHLPLCYALTASALGLDRDSAIYMFLFMYVRALISAAVRLNIVGPYAGQQCLSRAEPRVCRIVDGWWARDTAAAAPRQTNPLLDLLQGHHDRLYSKMFSS